MSRERLTLVERLVRLRELEEQQEAMALRERMNDRADAERNETEAMQNLLALAGGKDSGAGGGLDLGRYQNTLALESRAIEGVVAAGEKRRQAEAAHDAALASHGEAAAAKKVSETRRHRLAEQVRYDEEIRESDRLADLRASRSGDSR